MENATCLTAANEELWVTACRNILHQNVKDNGTMQLNQLFDKMDNVCFLDVNKLYE